MVESAANFRKNGFGDEESAQLARVAALLQNVADEEISAGTATAQPRVPGNAKAVGSPVSF